MDKEKQDLIDDLARKMAVNDLMYDYRIRAVTDFAEKLENLFAIPVVMPRFNVNYYVTIYPNDIGWQKIIEIISEQYNMSKEDARRKVQKRTTKDNGYKDQLWCIMSELHSMYFNGQNYFENSYMLFENGA